MRKNLTIKQLSSLRLPPSLSNISLSHSFPSPSHSFYLSLVHAYEIFVHLTNQLVLQPQTSDLTITDDPETPDLPQQLGEHPLTTTTPAHITQHLLVTPLPYPQNDNCRPLQANISSQPKASPLPSLPSSTIPPPPSLQTKTQTSKTKHPPSSKHKKGKKSPPLRTYHKKPSIYTYDFIPPLPPPPYVVSVDQLNDDEYEEYLRINQEKIQKAKDNPQQVLNTQTLQLSEEPATYYYPTLPSTLIITDTPPHQPFSEDPCPPNPLTVVTPTHLMTKPHPP